VFVGEAPGADEDRRGEPFVGRAGELLDKIIKAMDEGELIPAAARPRHGLHLQRAQVPPPENRNPLPHEIESCSPYLRRQLAAIKPRIICCLGKFAAELLVGVKGTIGGLRGKVYRTRAPSSSSPTTRGVPEESGLQAPVWEDMQLLAREYLSD
jgi:DNA polymerase